jgi:cell division protein FtsZ
MYREGIHDVTYVMCNTDKKALSDSPVPTHLQLGRDGLGAGNRPERGKQAALESLDEIKEMLNDGTRMVFITAGMGGGTGTGAAPIIAQCAKDAGILTVGIVTIPFKFEGMKKINQALDGVDEISKHVDALLVINNERLREIYPDLTVLNAFAKADDTLSIAARSIAEIITMHGIMNLDFQDVTTVLKDGGVAIMSTGYGEGENRVTKAIEQALNSPLLNNRDIFDSKKVLININFCGDNEQNSLMMEEMNEVNDFMSRFSQDVETKWGLATDSSLGGKVKITLLATGFNLLNVPGIEQVKKEKDIIDEAENDDRLVREGERIARYYDEITQAPRKRLHNIFIFTDDDLDNEDVIAEIDVRPTYKRTRDEVKRIREKEAATTVPSPLEDGGFIINQP